MIIEKNQTNYIIVIAKNDEQIKIVKKYLVDKFGNLDISLNNNGLYIIQNEFSNEIINIENELEEIKNLLDNGFILINKFESDDTGDIEIHYYFGETIKSDYYTNYEEYYGKNFDYYDEKIKKENIFNEIEKIINNNIKNLSLIEKENIKNIGFEVIDEKKEYKKSDIFKLDIDEKSNKIEFNNINKSKPAKVFIFPENIEYLKCPIMVTKVEKVIFNDKLKEIDYLGFAHLNKLTEIKLPSSVEKIDVDAFSYDTNLKVVDLSDTQIKVLNCIFDGCTSLESIYLPDTINEINECNNQCIFKDCMNATIYSNSPKIIEYTKKYDLKIKNNEKKSL